MGYTDHRGARGVERFMKHYFLVAKDVGDLTRIFCTALEIEPSRKPALRAAGLHAAHSARSTGFAVENDRLTVAETTAFARRPGQLPAHLPGGAADTGSTSTPTRCG